MKPCIECGEPSSSTRCDEHKIRRPDTRPKDRVTRTNLAPWKNLSARLRRLQPWCSVPGCGDTDLTVDHIVPLSDGGDPYDLDNLQVLCRRHNSAKDRGDGVAEGRLRPPGKAEGPSLTARRSR